MPPKGEFLCICRGCSSKTGKGTSLFTIPKDFIRAEVWLKAANREDLLEKSVEELHKNYRLCEYHFEAKCPSGIFDFNLDKTKITPSLLAPPDATQTTVNLSPIPGNVGGDFKEELMPTRLKWCSQPYNG
ncbi:unnamed protein product [Brassicogethes aeneus]|uniref:THAP-type domain-containing protein n=1 Tax=Brassicogethes aeneus TaxID=1431903 RepID=A0A9P0B677_BRAAE|nr:unnamed protein product [Brassicogethes aeneus]